MTDERIKKETEKIYTVVYDGKKVKKSYREICKELGFIPEALFIEITNRGTISFYVGKPNELRALYRAVNESPYKMSQALKKIINYT